MNVYLGTMDDKQLYTEILGINAPWELVDVKMNLATEEVVISIQYTKSVAPCAVRNIAFMIRATVADGDIWTCAN